MSFSHAYVIFTNGLEKVVPLTAISNFYPESDSDFDENRNVWLRQGKYNLLNAIILLLGSKYVL